jgi:tetraacyldisaccharide 4'-kinase
LTLALARALALRGEKVAVVGHGHAARVRAARRVTPGDTARGVGDDALWLARDLAELGVPVIVGPRPEAVLVAAGLAGLVLVDGLLQAAPVRLALSILAVDALAPWGAGQCPPAGDLRAPRQALLAAADVVAAVHADGERAPLAATPDHPGPSSGEPGCPPAAGPWDAPSVAELEASAGALDRAVRRVGAELTAVCAASGCPVPLHELAGARIGLVLAVARPLRIVASLARRGIHPTETRLYSDHAVPVRSEGAGWLLGRRRGSVDLWLTTPKCASKLGPTHAGARVLVLHHRMVVPSALVVSVAEARGAAP